jgi:hypothetical protein
MTLHYSQMKAGQISVKIVKIQYFLFIPLFSRKTSIKENEDPQFSAHT